MTTRKHIAAKTEKLSERLYVIYAELLVVQMDAHAVSFPDTGIINATREIEWAAKLAASQAAQMK